MFHRSGPDAPRLPNLPSLLRWPLTELLGGVASGGGEGGCERDSAPPSSSETALMGVDTTPTNGAASGATSRDEGVCGDGVGTVGVSRGSGGEGRNSISTDNDNDDAANAWNACNAYICDGATRVSRRGALTWWHLDDGGEAVLQVT